MRKRQSSRLPCCSQMRWHQRMIRAATSGFRIRISRLVNVTWIEAVSRVFEVAFLLCSDPNLKGLLLGDALEPRYKGIMAPSKLHQDGFI
jgi:hypothetical protein